jgi:hypothetical protein
MLENADQAATPAPAGKDTGTKVIVVPPLADEGLTRAIDALNRLAAAGATAATEAALCPVGTAQRRRLLDLRDRAEERWSGAARRLAELRPKTLAGRRLKLQAMAELPTQHPSRWGATA